MQNGVYFSPTHQSYAGRESVRDPMTPMATGDEDAAAAAGSGAGGDRGGYESLPDMDSSTGEVMVNNPQAILNYYLSKSLHVYYMYSVTVL